MAFWDRFRRQPRTDAPQLAGDVAPKTTRADDIMNWLMGHGTDRDKRTATGFYADVVDDVTARELYRGNDLAKKTIETLPKDSMRNGYELDLDGDKGLAAEVADALGKLKVNRTITQAKCWERAYGGAAIFPVINDGGDPSEPLNEERITEIRNLIVFEPRELIPTRWYNDIENDAKFREPKAYRVYPLFGGGAPVTRPGEIHESRLIMFSGIRVSNLAIAGNRPGFGDSVLTRQNRILQQFDLSWSSANALINDFAQAIYSIKDLAQAIEEGGEDDIKARIALIDRMRSTMRVVPIDSEDKFERTETPITGLADLLDREMIRLSACFDMPVTKLFGRSPAGMNATGESDMDMWDDTCSSMQEDELTDPVMRLVNLVLKSKKGPTKGKVPKNVGLEWRPLRQPTELETAQAHEAQARADGEYIDRQVASPEEIAHSRWGGDGYSYETTIDWKARKAEKMVVDPIVKPEPEVLLGPDGQPLAPPPMPGAPPVDNGEIDEGNQPTGDAGKREARAVAQRAADSLPIRLRYDAIDIAVQKAQGVMIAVYPPSAIAKQMAVKGGIPAEDLHMTLAYLGTDLPDVAVQRAVGVAYDAAMRCAAPRGKVGGVGTFLGSAASNGLDIAYLSVDSPEIGKLRHRICEHLECCNVPVSKEHGFIPHISIAYLDPGEKPQVKTTPAYELEFGALVVSAGNERMVFPFKGERDELGMPKGYY